MTNPTNHRPRILVTIHYLEIGGAERALIGLLNALDKERFDIDLFLYSHRGEFMPLIPAGVRLLPEIPAYSALERPMKEIICEGHWRIAWGRLKAKWKYKRYLRYHKITSSSAIFQYFSDETTPYLPSLEKYGRYDLAISFLPNNIVRDKVSARTKIVWIHTDYSYLDVDREAELPMWMSYNFIVSISPAVTAAFLKTFPEAKDKILQIENIISPSFVRRQAALLNVSDEMPSEDGVIKLCSVGRYSEAKNFDNVPDICRRLHAEGLSVKWYIIGYGGDESLLRQYINEAGMSEWVILLGKKTNPYPYIAACDLYVQPSRYEGKAVTVREAQILCKPVAVTAFPTAGSQVIDGVDGVIVPLDNAGCAEGLAHILRTPDRMNQLSAYLHLHDYSNEAEARKVEALALGR